jgi:hypothetical protein
MWWIFIKKLFGTTMHKGVHLVSGFWPQETIGETHKVLLCSPFSEKDVETAIMGMKVESTPGPNGLTMTFLGNFENN